MPQNNEEEEEVRRRERNIWRSVKIEDTTHRTLKKPRCMLIMEEERWSQRGGEWRSVKLQSVKCKTLQKYHSIMYRKILLIEIVDSWWNVTLSQQLFSTFVSSINVTSLIWHPQSPFEIPQDKSTKHSRLGWVSRVKNLLSVSYFISRGIVFMSSHGEMRCDFYLSAHINVCLVISISSIVELLRK